MSKQAKIYIISICIIILICVVSVICIFYPFEETKVKGGNKNSTTNNQEDEYFVILGDGSKVNNSKKLKKDKKFNGLEFTNINLTEDNDITNLTADVTNETNKIKQEQTANVTFIDYEGNELAEMQIYIKELQPNETTKIDASITFDYANAYDFTIEN